MTGRTTINIDKEIRDALKRNRIYKRETYDETLKRLIKEKRKKSKQKGEVMDSYQEEDQISELKKRGLL